MRSRSAYALAWLLFGCGQILGISDAELDPSLSSAGARDSRTDSTPAAGGSASSGSQSAAGSAVQAGFVADSGSAGEEAADAGGAASSHDGGASGVGSSLCAQYCTEVTSGCSDEHSQYLDLEGCLAICPLLPAGSPGDTTGNSVSCRLTYAKKASSEPYTYCTWAGPGGDGKCGSNCEGFCAVMMQECTAQSTGVGDDYYPTLNSCMTACSALKDVGKYSATDPSLQTGADHVQCRLYHVDAAVTEDDPTTHCPHATGQSLCRAPSPMN